MGRLFPPLMLSDIPDYRTGCHSVNIVSRHISSIIVSLWLTYEPVIGKKVKEQEASPATPSEDPNSQHHLADIDHDVIDFRALAPSDRDLMLSSPLPIPGTIDQHFMPDQLHDQQISSWPQNSNIMAQDMANTELGRSLQPGVLRKFVPSTYTCNNIASHAVYLPSTQQQAQNLQNQQRQFMYTDVSSISNVSVQPPLHRYSVSSTR